MQLWTDYEGVTIDGAFPLQKLLMPEGRSAFFSTAGPNDEPTVVRLIVAALDVLHTHGFIHEHIEPRNVFAVSGVVKLRRPPNSCRARCSQTARSAQLQVCPRWSVEGSAAAPRSVAPSSARLRADPTHAPAGPCGFVR